MPLDATLGGASANSYVTVAEADAYFAYRLGSDAWTNADAATKEASLIMATSNLEPLNWEGSKSSETQALRWPRNGVYDRDGLLVLGIPNDIKNAVYEFSMYLVSNASSFGTVSSGGNKVIKVGPLEIEKFSESSSSGVGYSSLPALVKNSLSYYLKSTGSMSRLVRS